MPVERIVNKHCYTRLIIGNASQSSSTFSLLHVIYRLSDEAHRNWRDKYFDKTQT